jgi:predicted Ser/Thr protein kinase
METERICPNCQKPLPPGVPLGLCPECLIKSGFPTGTEPGSGAMGRFAPPPVEEIGKLFPQFEILGFIGKGGMGAVYKARQPGLDRLIALKILPPAVANDPGFAERFNREARALARLSHPNIVAVYDFGKAGELHYLVMEFVDGANLREVERAGKLSPDQALAIVPQICEALQFAHNEGIVHRDIKPENLLLDKKGRLKITDFGIAKIINVTEGKASLTGAKDVMGTPHYMAPEQIERPQTVDHRADIYSLGVVFYEMLTGELPLGKFAPPSKKAPMDARLDEVVMHTLEKEPDRRYQHASQVKTDVETIATGAPPRPIGRAPIPGAIPPIPPVPLHPAVSDRVILPAFLLAFFFGIFGAHRFYVGKIRTGLLQLAGLGGCVLLTIISATSHGDETIPGILLATFICGCGAWTAIDWIMILCKVFTDGNGRRLVNWWHPNPNAPQPPVPPIPPKAPVPPIAGGAPSGGGGHAMIIAPAVALIVAGCLKIFGTLLGVFYLLAFGAITHEHSFFFIPGFIHFLPPFVAIAALLFSVIPAAVIIYGGVEMFRLRSYGWAVAASIVAIMFCSLVGTPVGIWALIVLLMAGVRETFGNWPAPPPRVKGFWIVGAVAVACLLLFLTIIFFAFLVHTSPRVEAYSPPPMAVAAPASLMPPTPPLPPTVPTPPEVLSSDPSNEVQVQFNEALMELTNMQAQYRVGIVATDAVVAAQEQISVLQAEMAGNGVEAAKARLDAAQRLLELDKQHYAAGLSTRSDYEKASADLAMAEAQLRGAETAARKANAQAMAAGTLPLTYQWNMIPTNNAASAADPPGTLTIPTHERDDAGDSRDFSKSFAVGPNGSLAMDVDRGDVRIAGGNGTTVEIHVERDVKGASDDDASKILQDEHVVVEQHGNRISITAQNPFSLHASSWLGLFNQPNLVVHYEITVPRGFTVQSKTSGGDLKVGGVRGNADVSTMGGKLECIDIGGDVDGNNMGGSVLARGCSGKLNLQTMGGDITVDNFTGPGVQASASGGSVSADFVNAPTADCDFHTVGGNVTVRLPDTAAVTLDGHTMGGDVKTDFPLQPKEGFGNDSVSGPVNGGGPTLKMDTTGGSIEVWKRTSRSLSQNSSSALPSSPPQMASSQIAGNDAAVAAAESWLPIIDRGNFGESWNESAPAFQNAVSQTKWEDSMNAFRQPLGNQLSRKLISAKHVTQMPGVPDGDYVVMQFKTSFENKPTAVETVTVGPKTDDQWKVSGYYIK